MRKRDPADQTPSMTRLLAAGQAKGHEGPIAVADAIGVGHQTASNWGARGVSRDGALRAQSTLGVSAEWVLSGSGSVPLWIGPTGGNTTHISAGRVCEPEVIYRLKPSAALQKIVAAFRGQDSAVRSAAAELVADAVRRPDTAELLGRKLDALVEDLGNAEQQAA